MLQLELNRVSKRGHNWVYPYHSPLFYCHCASNTVAQGSAVKQVLLLCYFVRFYAGKIALALQRESTFYSAKSNELTGQHGIFV